MPPEVRITTDDSVMVFGGGFGDEAYLVGSIEMEGPGVLVHLTDAHPWEPPGESMTLFIQPDVLRRIAAIVAPHVERHHDELEVGDDVIDGRMVA